MRGLSVLAVFMLLLRISFSLCSSRRGACVCVLHGVKYFDLGVHAVYVYKSYTCLQ
jgi:hypothetical protein